MEAPSVASLGGGQLLQTLRGNLISGIGKEPEEAGESALRKVLEEMRCGE